MKNNEPAFPSDFTTSNHGMSLRDYFAAKTMLAILHYEASIGTIAKSSYAMADAMLKVRGE